MALSLEGVEICLNGRSLLRAFALAMERGEIVTLMGPSGSGKSSLLAYVAGDLEPPLLGRGIIRLGDCVLNGVAAGRRRIGRLFQDDLLFPHLTVGENLLFGVPRGLRLDRLVKMRDGLAQAGLAGFEDRAPHTLSGGERARIALFRSLLAEPRAMLLDEPFSKLDSELRQSMREYVFAHLRERGIPSLLVTHDRADAPPGGQIFVITRDGEVRHA